MPKSEYKIAIRARVDTSLVDVVRKLARKENRSLSNMFEVLVAEALVGRSAVRASRRDD